MDPNQALEDLDYFMHSGDRDDALDAAYALSYWIRMGGFEPDWSAFPEATDFFRKECAE